MKVIGVALMTCASIFLFVMSVGLVEDPTVSLWITTPISLLSMVGIFIGLAAFRIIEFLPYLHLSESRRK